MLNASKLGAWIRRLKRDKRSSGKQKSNTTSMGDASTRLARPSKEKEFCNHEAHLKLIEKSDGIARYVDTIYKHQKHTTSEMDVAIANSCGALLLYGEIIPSSVSKLVELDSLALSGVTRNITAAQEDAQGRPVQRTLAAAKVAIDLGCGLGKIPVQLFLQCLNLEHVIGVDLCQSRINRCVSVIREMLVPDLAVNNYSLQAERDFIRRKQLLSSAASLREGLSSSFETGKVEIDFPCLEEKYVAEEGEAGAWGEDQQGVEITETIKDYFITEDELKLMADDREEEEVEKEGVTRKRKLEIIRANFHEERVLRLVSTADVVFFMIEIEKGDTDTLKIVSRMKPGARIVSYRTLGSLCKDSLKSLGSLELPCTWNYQGARLYLYQKKKKGPSSVVVEH
eukprot:TRINITY_DN16495_c0_g1_i1.p1 TRINITY_DN16495_c0_g1~~TRINITY_DN16495_c0_g1_i1.p1  ORF type:complete len:397 (+),score=85.41 TRINITY_DN16495_c0_g1_i1:145-1335(+)